MRLSTAKFYIRKASGKDLERIHELDVESTTYHRQFDKGVYEVSEKWWDVKKESQRKALKSSNDLILVAERDGETVGYVWGYVETMGKSKVGKFQDLSVNARHRRKGIARELVKHLTDFFRQKGCDVSEVEVSAKNVQALKFYEKAGFDVKSCRMRKKLKKGQFSPFS